MIYLIVWGWILGVGGLNSNISVGKEQGDCDVFQYLFINSWVG
jgi:hypothetical protein